MKKIGKIAACGLLAALGITAMTSCGEKKDSLATTILNKIILTQDGEKVSADFDVPKAVKHENVSYDVTWTSSDTSVLNFVSKDEAFYTADVKRPFGENESANVDVTLTASITVDGKSTSGNFKTTVTAIKAETALSSAITNLGIKASYGTKEELTLPTTSNEYKDEITFDYSLGGEYVSANLDGTKLTLDPELGQEAIVVKVKAKSGSTEVEQDVNTRTSLKTVYLSVTDALAQPKDAMIYVQGKIKSVASNGETYGNFWIEDEAGKEIEIYGLYKGLIENCYDAENTWLKKGIRYDAWEDFEKLAVGDYVYVYGKRDTYKTTEEITNCILMGIVKNYPVSTVKEALDTPVGEYVTVYGEIKSISGDYGNTYIKDSEGNEIYLYGLYTGKVAECYDADSKWVSSKATRYDKMTDKPQVGDVIAVYGPRTEYKGTQQITNALLLYYVSKVERKSETPETPETPVTPTPSITPTDTAKSNVSEAGQIHTFDNPVTSLNLDESKFSVTYSPVNGVSSSGESYSNNPYLNTDKEIRLYGSKEDGKGCSITFTVAEGYKIEKVVVTIASGDKGGVLQVSAGETVLTATDGIYTVNGNTVTIQNVTKGNTNQLWIEKVEFVVSAA